MNMSSAFAAAPASYRHAHRQYVAGVIAFLSFSSSSRETYRSLQKSSIEETSCDVAAMKYPSYSIRFDDLEQLVQLIFDEE